MARTTIAFGWLVGIIGLSGCKVTSTTTPTNPTAAAAPTGISSLIPSMSGNADGKGLLIGPEAISQAPQAVELPAKDSARLCIKTAQELEKAGATEEAVSEATKEAIGLYEKARSLDPTTAKHAGRRLAVLYDRIGESTKATTEYDALLKLTPNDADLLNDIGYSYYNRGDWANAETFLLKATQIDANHKRAWMNLGLTFAQRFKWEESFHAFCKAVRPADAHCNVAFALASQGRTEEAKVEYRKALALDPSLKVAQGALAMLEDPKPRSKELTPLGGRKATKNYDAAEAAAKVPTFWELEERLRNEAGVVPAKVAEPTAPAAPKPDVSVGLPR